ncbi:MAG: bifunctional UDP-N-acetylglucosamine diphosphorylase/glucosamine-1-phosphate N-acetyltransferase GlmU, partial [Pseudomonadota bacterium]
DAPTPERPTAAVILAAGDGTRMRSDLPKALHAVGGAPMLVHVLQAAETLRPDRVVVVTGRGGPEVEAAARGARADVTAVPQIERLGTGHAARVALPALEGFDGDVFILYADSPLFRPETLRRMAQARAAGADVVVLGFEAADPTGYGRLILDAAGALARIVEHKDATEAERATTFCNSGVVCADAQALARLLPRITNDNAKGEFYLTDLVALARADGLAAAAVACPEAETLGVNSRAELAAAEAAFQARARAAAMEAGATLTAPETVFFALDTRLGRDVTVGPNVVFGPGAIVEDGAEIRAFCHIEGARIASGAKIGPFARLRPGADIGEHAVVGNFVEVKNAALARGAKASHLTYLGDAEIGAAANIGAGTITCNYDGYLKHRTTVGAGAFIGSNTALVAPVSVGAGASVGAGSVLTEDVPEDALAVARAPQEIRAGAAARLRRRLAALKDTLTGGSDPRKET